MTRETRVSLLVGLAIIIFFGIIIGERSLNPPEPSASASKSGKSTKVEIPPPGPSHELLTATISSNLHDTRPVLAPTTMPARRAARGSVSQASPVSPTSAGPGSSGRKIPARKPTVPPAERHASPGNADAVRQVQQERPSTIVPETISTYRVRRGDTLIGIARKVYGRAGRTEYLRIFRANRDKLTDPQVLPVGVVLTIPPLKGESRAMVRVGRTGKHYTEMTLEQMERHFNAGKVYVVRAGDNLTRIARRTMGDGSRSAVMKLLRVNRKRIKDPDRLTVGMKLIIPQ